MCVCVYVCIHDTLVYQGRFYLFVSCASAASVHLLMYKLVMDGEGPHGNVRRRGRNHGCKRQSSDTAHAVMMHHMIAATVGEENYNEEKDSTNLECVFVKLLAHFAFWQTDRDLGSYDSARCIRSGSFLFSSRHHLDGCNHACRITLATHTKFRNTCTYNPASHHNIM